MGLFRKAVTAFTTFASGLNLGNPDLYRFFGGEPSHSGERVTVDTALSLDAVWACVRLIAETIATLPVVVHQREGEGAVPAIDHPLYRVIHDRPNADMTAVEFWTAMIGCKLLWGNAYALITLRGDGAISSLYPLLPQFMTVQLQRDGSRTFTYNFRGQVHTYSEMEILHLKGFSLDGLTGISAISAGKHSLGLAMAAERVSGRTFRNSMRPSGVFMAPAYLDKTQRSDAKTYLAEFEGAQNAGKVPVLEGGWKFEQMTLSPADAELLATRGFNVETICRWFDVPPSMIGHVQKTTTWGTGLEQINLAFLTYCLRKHLKETEQALQARCLKPTEQSLYYVQFNVEGLLRADSKGRADYYRVMIASGIMTPNEVRKLENLPPVEGGDKLFMQGAMMPIELLIEQAEAGIENANREMLPIVGDPEGQEDDQRQRQISDGGEDERSPLRISRTDRRSNLPRRQIGARP